MRNLGLEKTLNLIIKKFLRGVPLVIPLVFFSLSQIAQASPDNWYKIRGVSGTPSETRIRLAQMGEPIWFTVKNTRGNSLREVIEIVCGKQPKAVINVLFEQALRDNYAKSLDDKIRDTVTVAVPFCLKVEENVVVEVQPGDTLEEILEERYGVYGPRTIERTFVLNQARYPSFEDAEEFTRNLPSEKNIIIPYQSTEQVFIPRSNESLEPPQIINDLPRNSLFIPIKNNITLVRSTKEVEPVIKKNKVEFVRFVASQEAQSTPNCVIKDQGHKPVPFFDIKQFNSRILAELQMLTSSGENSNAATLGIIDSGVAKELFSEKYFLANEQEKTGEKNKDDDDNGPKDDIYGFNFNNDSGIIDPDPEDPQKSHGTQMASLILGGPTFVAQYPETQNPLIRLKVVNFSSGHGPVSPRNLPTAMHYLSKQEASIINISLTSKTEFWPISNAIEGHPNTLFIVAAGNGNEGSSLSHLKLYPARWGGGSGIQKRNVVTVGAHNLVGKRADFSNFSKDYVDLLAPGCSVETQDIEGKVVPVGGTSPATGIVSFAAGLIRKLGEKDPPRIKNRLLISTDIDDQLSDDAWSSGRLNIIKAISIRHDVITLFKGPSEYLYGKILDPKELWKFCKYVEKPSISLKDIQENALQKVRPNIETDTIINQKITKVTKIEYWTEIDNELQKTRCVQGSSEETIGSMKINGKNAEGPVLNEIGDIVFGRFVKRG